MKATFKDFLDNSPTYRNICHTPEAKHIFENILSKDSNIIAMIDASNDNKAALSGCIREVEEYHSNHPTTSFDIRERRFRQALGTMVKVILEPFGYQKQSEKRLPKRKGGIIVTASTYALTGTASLKVVRKIEPV